MVCYRAFIAGWLSVSSFLVIGCGSGSSDSPSRSGSTERVVAEVPGPQSEPELDDTSSETVTDSEPSATLSLKLGNQATLLELIKSHRGRVVLVDYWATWCDPCRKKFPHTVELARQHAADGLTVIGVAMDDEEAHGDVEAFLKEQQAKFENLRSKDGTSDSAFEEFDIPDGAIPCLRLFDREGKVARTFSQFTDKEVAEAVRDLLAK